MDQPMDKLYLDDFKPGDVIECGSVTITEPEIVEFATKYDPQSFHVDAEAAKESFFGGLIASGWQTASLAMRLLVDGYIHRSASMGSPGVDELRWLKPVRPGDTLTVRVNVEEVRPSTSKPDRGVLRSTTEVLNQHGEVVMTMKGMGMFKRRGEG